MNYWKCNRWKKTDTSKFFNKKGIHLRIDPAVDPEVRRACLEFSKWIRSQYQFPIRVIVYIKATEYIIAQNGESVFGTCWRPCEKSFPPYIRIATGDYEKMLSECSQDEALAAILHCMASMLTHYYMWLNDISFSSQNEEEKTADKYASKIIQKYAETRDHP